MEVPSNLYDEIKLYCKVNNIENIDNFVNKLIKQGFTIEKYGATPKERIVEIIKEVPIEKIVTDDQQIKDINDKLDLEIAKNEELNKKISELNKEILQLKYKKDLYGEK
jgi:hypothetical protein